MMLEPVTVLVVCTANQCRSPMAEFLLREALARRPAGAPPWRVWSAGVHALDGQPIELRAGHELARRGIDASAFRSQLLTKDLIDRSDLVLTATRAHRGRVVSLAPAATAKAFTLSQAGSLVTAAAAQDQVGRDLTADQVVAVINAGRTWAGFRQASDDDIDDPIGRSPRVYRRCADRIARDIDALLLAARPA